MRSRSPAREPAAKDSPTLQRKPDLRIGEHDDAHEREADRVADAIVAGRTAPGGFSLSAISIAPPVQRDEGGGKKSQEDEYKEALKKAGEAFLETGPGKEIKRKAEKLGESFIATLPGKIITGSAVTGAVAALAATHKELPIGIPEIPLDMIRPGLKMKITYEGPVDKPTNVSVGFSIPLGAPAPAPKPGKSKSERYRSETARMARELHQFRESMKTPEQRAEEQALINAWVMSQQWGHGLPLTPGSGAALPPPLVPYAPEYRVTGERPKTSEPEKKKKKKDEAVQRKSNNGARVNGTPAVVGEALESAGQPLDPGARQFMESRFGRDFSHVRVHTDSLAARSAAAINALAYTSGSRIVFGHGQYSPHTEAGRRLLAHELTHVLQQSGGASAPRLDSPLRRKSNVPAPSLSPADALAETLKGDDDSVRALTESPVWGAVVLTPGEAALLLIQLLDGATLDADEAAGLKVLKKTIAQSILDDSLSSLATRNYFRQLLHDYHGAEYRWLLDLLSMNISKVPVKALFLDAFIAMWWVNETEEEAIVMLLELTGRKDQHELLTAKNRLQELRDAIDTDALTIRYEKIAGNVNELRQKDLAAQLQKLFVVISKDKKAAKNRTPEETERLLKAAARDLAKELTDYRLRLEMLLKAAEPDADAIAELNADFETRLKFLLERKQEEFRVELKYGVELNRLVYDLERPGLSWNLDALNNIDEILGQIPPEMLLANPKFKAIARGVRRSRVAGSAPLSGEKLNVFGTLSLSTTAHELGHVISYDNNERLQDEFDTEFGWEELSASDMTSLVPERKARERLIRKMDADHEAKRGSRGDRYAHAGYFYRMDRYGDKGSYLRHPKTLCFVSDYAATDRYDDFAESFEAYVVQPGRLHKACPAKYRFMRRRVFTGYLYGKQSASVLAAFDKETEARLKNLKLGGELPKKLEERILRKLREDLEKNLEGTGEALERKALEEKPADDMKRVPLTGKEAQVAAKPYRDRLDALFKLMGELPKPWRSIRLRLDDLAKIDPPERRKTAKFVALKLRREFLEDVLKLVQPPANRVLAGRDADAKTLPEQLQALVKQCDEAVKVAPSYLVEYELLTDRQFGIEAEMLISPSEESLVGPTAWKLLQKIPKSDPRREDFKRFATKRRKKVKRAYGDLRIRIVQEIKAGIPREKSKAAAYDDLTRDYRRDIADRAVKDILAIISRLDSAARDKTLRELGRERADLERKINELRESWDAEKDEVKRADILDRARAIGAVRSALDRIIQAISSGIVLSESRADLEAATHVPTAAEKTEILSALKPDVKRSKSGTPVPFESMLPGEKKDYEQKLREHMPDMIQGYWDSMVKGRGTAEHSDPDKVHDLKRFEEIGNASKKETDKLFGSYKTGPALRADTKKRRGNIHDLFADMESDLRDMDSTQRRNLARQLIYYFFQSDDFVRNLNRQHNASPKFSSSGRPLNDEAKSLRRLAVEFTRTRKQVKKLNEIDRGWGATAGGGHINIQIFTGETEEKDRDFLWDMFQTLIHEYLHTLVHKDYERYAEKFGDTSNEYNTLIEGVDSLLTEIVWSNVEPRVNDPDLRKIVEGPKYAKKPPITVKPASRSRYASYAEAIKVVNIVGIRNLYVAYFLGKIDRIGG